MNLLKPLSRTTDCPLPQTGSNDLGGGSSASSCQSSASVHEGSAESNVDHDKRRQAIGLIGTGTLTTLIAGGWNRPVIQTVLLPAHALTSDPVVFVISAVARTDTGLFVSFDTNNKAPVTLTVSSIPAGDPTDKIKKQFQPPVNTLIISPPLPAPPGHTYKIKVEQAGLRKSTTLKVQASVDFFMFVSNLTLFESTITAGIELSETVRTDELCTVTIEIHDKTNRPIGSKTVNPVINETRATVDITTNQLGFTLPTSGIITLRAKMTRRNIFGNESATASIRY